MIVPCSRLQVGSWLRRTKPDRYDLVAYYDFDDGRLTYFMIADDTDYAVKMEVRLVTINKADIITAPGEDNARLTYTLRTPPVFYMEVQKNPSSPLAALRAAKHHTPTLKVWTPCNDWTHDEQGSTVLRHSLYGPTRALQDVLALIRTVRAAPPSSIPHDVITATRDHDRNADRPQTGVLVCDDLQEGWRGAHIGTVETEGCTVTTSPDWSVGERAPLPGGSTSQLPIPGHPILPGALGPEPIATHLQLDDIQVHNALNTPSGQSSALDYSPFTVWDYSTLETPFMPMRVSTPLLSPIAIGNMPLAYPYNNQYIQFSPDAHVDFSYEPIMSTDAYNAYNDASQDAYLEAGTDLQIHYDASFGPSGPEDASPDLFNDGAW